MTESEARARLPPQQHIWVMHGVCELRHRPAGQRWMFLLPAWSRSGRLILEMCLPLCTGTARGKGLVTRRALLRVSLRVIWDEKGVPSPGTRGQGNCPLFLLLHFDYLGATKRAKHTQCSRMSEAGPIPALGPVPQAVQSSVIPRFLTA